VSDLFWPGDERAGGLMSDVALLRAMVAMEDAWLASLVAAGVAPATARRPVQDLVRADDVDTLSRRAEADGNPVTGLVALLRERLGEGDAARWLHRGLTSQDVLDTALVLSLREVLDRLLDDLRAQVRSLRALAEQHRAAAMVGRTLTQHAVPITFGLKAASWLSGIVEAAEGLRLVRVRLAAQVGGAAGTLAAAAELARLQGLADPPAVAVALRASTARALGLEARTSWHTTRSPVTAVGDALVTCTDAWGHLASDVATLSRPEIGELAEGRGGGSSTMPHKQNPVLSVLVRRAALTTPQLAASLHLASAGTVDERPDGAWHAEWATLRDLARRAVVAGSQTTDLVAGLRVDTERMRATLDAAVGLYAEQGSMAGVAGGEPSGPYLGATDLTITAVLTRARTFLEETA
jgi:3-carboxy-cis,cis-muconate cycloisomerase